MKKFTKILIIVTITLGFLYWIGTQNFYLGSNSTFFNTAFEIDNSEWENKSLNLSATLETSTMQHNKTYMCIRNNENEYYLFPRGDKLADLYYKNTSLDIEESAFISTLQIKYKKRFGKVYAFELYSIPPDNKILNYGNTIIFKLK